MTRLLAMSLSLMFLASQSLPADAHGNDDNVRSPAAPAQRSAPVQQPQPRQAFQQPPNTPYAQRSTGYVPAQSYQWPAQQPQRDNGFQAHPGVPQPMFDNHVNTGPTYRTAPSFRGTQPTSWNVRFALTPTSGDRGQRVGWNARFQQRGNANVDANSHAGASRGYGGGHVFWQQRFDHRSDHGYWNHHGAGDGGNWNDKLGGVSARDGNLAVPIFAVAALQRR